MKIGVSIVPTNFYEDIEIISKLVEIGLKFISLSDYHKAKDPFQLLEKISQTFMGLKIGTAVTNFLIREPEFVADFFLRLYKESRNEFFIGIGAGDWFLLDIRNISAKKAIEKLKEGIFKIKDIFEKENAKIKIYVGAQGTSTLKLIEMVDGLIINLASYSDLKKALDYLKENKRKEIFAIAQTSLNINEARKSATIIYAGLSDSSLKLYGFDKSKRDKIRELLKQGELEKARAILNEEEVRRVTLCGSNEEIFNRIKKILELGIDGFIMGLPMSKEKYEVIKFLEEYYLHFSHSFLKF
ncbi:MAG: LLM class flavin-dependent oxidoreductase [Thermoproteota archaeon]|nr:LLM class flavin-dependent oxidoreductase [Thermoproteota archaeon]